MNIHSVFYLISIFRFKKYEIHRSKTDPDFSFWFRINVFRQHNRTTLVSVSYMVQHEPNQKGTIEKIKPNQIQITSSPIAIPLTGSQPNQSQRAKHQREHLQRNQNQQQNRRQKRKNLPRTININLNKSPNLNFPPSGIIPVHILNSLIQEPNFGQPH